MSDLENPLTELLDIERKFYDARYEFYKKVDRYFRQSIASNYVTEDELSEHLDKCKSLRKKYFEFKESFDSNISKKA